jgi:hypothetical protein
MRRQKLCRFPFQEIEHTHKEAVSIGHAVKRKKKTIIELRMRRDDM